MSPNWQCRMKKTGLFCNTVSYQSQQWKLTQESKFNFFSGLLNNFYKAKGAIPVPFLLSNQKSNKFVHCIYLAKVRQSDMVVSGCRRIATLPPHVRSAHPPLSWPRSPPQPPGGGSRRSLSRPGSSSGQTPGRCSPCIGRGRRRGETFWCVKGLLYSA